jgi:hypothetical protein
MPGERSMTAADDSAKILATLRTSLNYIQKPAASKKGAKQGFTNVCRQTGTAPVQQSAIVVQIYAKVSSN